MIRKPLACDRKIHRCSRQASSRPGTPCSARSPRCRKVIHKNVYTAKSTCVNKYQSCGCRIHTVHNPEHTNTGCKIWSNFSCRFITCITPYSFIGFTPYSLVCLNGQVLLPWIVDLQELWVSQSRREVEAYLHQKQGFCASSFSIRQKPSSRGVADDGTMPLCIT